jgi:hypothetical protein
MILPAMNSNPPTRIRWSLDDPGPDDVSMAAPSPATMLSLGRRVWENFVLVFGDIADLAGQRIDRQRDAVLQTWIASLERIVRCLLLMMAFELALPRNPKPAPAPPVLQTRSVAAPDASGPDASGDDDAGADIDADDDAACDPDLWCVSLPILVTRYDLIDVADDWRWVEPAPRVRGLNDGPGDGLCSSASVARRAEAVLRILNDPEPYARRLALRLSQLWAPLAFPPPPPVRWLKPASIDHDPEPAPPPRAGPYDRWIAPARKRCVEMAAAYWGSG